MRAPWKARAALWMQTESSHAPAREGSSRSKAWKAEKTYTVTETESGELYRPANGSVEAEMPIYSSSQNVEITNDYLLRPLSVTKIVNI